MNWTCPICKKPLSGRNFRVSFIDTTCGQSVSKWVDHPQAKVVTKANTKIESANDLFRDLMLFNGCFVCLDEVVLRENKVAAHLFKMLWCVVREKEKFMPNCGHGRVLSTRT